ncbi:MAG: lactate/malate family dehydrogenase, partial [Candidatus Pararuminococcus gallinarum]
MGKKVTIIGAGSVGSTIAYTMAVNGIATEVVMIDINESKSMGEALDIRQGVPFCPPISIYAGSYPDAVDSDIVILTSGIARKPGQSRLELAQVNVDITKSIVAEIVKYAPNAVYIIVSNPVDILTYVFTKVSGLPEKQIIGSGTILDTARLRARLAEYFSINQQNVHAYVFGEHGDSSFVPWSVGSVSNIPID